jgi:hypothetical protein
MAATSEAATNNTLSFLLSGGWLRFSEPDTPEGAARRIHAGKHEPCKANVNLRLSSPNS